MLSGSEKLSRSDKARKKRTLVLRNSLMICLSFLILLSLVSTTVYANNNGLDNKLSILADKPLAVSQKTSESSDELNMQAALRDEQANADIISSENRDLKSAGGSSGSRGSGSDGNEDYYKAVSRMVKSHWSDDYFSKATLKVGDSAIKIDNRTVKLKNKVSAEQNELLISEEALEVLGVQIQKNAKGVSARKNGKHVDITYGEKSMNVDGKKKNMRNAPSVKNGDALVPESVLGEEGLGFEVDYNKSTGEIVITNDFQTMRVLAKVRSGESLPTDIQTEQTIDGPDGLYILQFNTVDEAKEACQKLNASSVVVYAEPDYVVTLSEAAMAEALPMANSYSHLGWGPEKIGSDSYIDYLIANGKQNTSVTVAVIDTGLDMTHPYFANRFVNGYNIVAGNANPTDDHYHGTHVAGTIVDVTIAMPNVKIMPVKVLDYAGYGTNIQIASGVRWAADNGAKVINMSLGGQANNTVDIAVLYAINKNITVVAAAGNGTNNNGIPADTINFSPARVKEAITVAAVGSNFNLASFTNYGQSVDVAAPGVDIASAKKGGGTHSLNGTSMAAPHVAGAAALLLCNNPALKPIAIEALICASADDKSTPGFDIYYGYGVLNIGNVAAGISTQMLLVSPGSFALDVGAGLQKKQLAVGYVSNGVYSDITSSATYLSNNPSVATVSSAGLVTVSNAGQANITVSYNGKTETIPVMGIIPQSIYLPQVFSLYAGETKALFVTAQYTDGITRVPEATWTSSNPLVATVTDGEITGISPGIATITARTSNNLTASCTVTVKELSISFNESTTPSDMLVGTRNAMIISPIIEGLTWTTSNSAVATVTPGFSNMGYPQGMITGISPGTATITAKAGNGSTTTHTVNIKKLGSISIPSNLQLYQSSNQLILLTAKSSDGIDVPLSWIEMDADWTSSNPSVVDVMGRGQDAELTGVSPGSATITANFAGKTAMCNVTVTKVTDFSISPSTLVTGVGLVNILNISDSIDATWTSSNPSVITIDGRGASAQVIGVSPGTAVITATAVSGAKATCNVTVKPIASISIIPQTLALAASKSYIFDATIKASDGANLSFHTSFLTWESNNPLVASFTFSNSPIMKSVSPGTATATVTAPGGLKSTCNVTVIDSTPVLEASPMEWNPSAGESLTTISVTSNISWRVSSYSSWFTVSPERDSGDGILTLKVTENKSSSSRTGLFSIISDVGSMSRTIRVTQSGTATVPGAPTNVSATAGNGSATVSFTAPASNGGSAITGYTVTSSPGNITATGTASPITVSGLTNGTAYTFTVKATNAAGTSAASAASTAVTPKTVPGAPTNVSATAGNGSATVSFTAPSSNGGSAITSHTVISSPGGITATGTGSPITVSGLTNGTAYTFTVTATNAAGTSAASAPSSAVTPTAPQYTVTYNGNGNTGGSVPVDSSSYYSGNAVTVRNNIGNLVRTNYTFLGWSTSSMAVTPTYAVNGTTVTPPTFNMESANVTLYAVWQPISNVITLTLNTPTTVAITSGGRREVKFTAPTAGTYVFESTNRGTLDPKAYTGSSGTGALDDDSGTDSRNYKFQKVLAANETFTYYSGFYNDSNVTGSYTVTATSVVTITVPGAPTNVSATAGNGSATVSFTAPASNGGSAITGYTVTSSPGNITATGTASPITVSGLTNGTAYTFTVKATNAAGTSAASAASTAVTPKTVPGAPTNVSATAGNGSATVSFTAPASNGGSAITSYTVTSNPGNITATGTGSPITISGLTNGTAYTFTVKATNAAGTSAASAPSSAVTPASQYPESAHPYANNLNINSSGNLQTYTYSGSAASLKVTFSSDTKVENSYDKIYVTDANGTNISGSPFTSTALAGITVTVPGNTVKIYITSDGSINYYGYRVTNIEAVTVTVPSVPQNFTATPGNGQVALSWTAPANNGGSSITSYQVSSNNGSTWVTASGNTGHTFNGLTNGTSYTFKVRAVNAAGNGTEASITATPRTVPGAPTNVSATAGNGSATVSFTAQASNGGSAITGYTVTSSPGNITATGTGSPITISGLTNGTAYTFTVKATNAAGTSAASAPSSAVTPASQYPESAHPYANNLNINSSGNLQTYTYQGSASNLKVTFSSDTKVENSYDKIYVTDANGTNISGSPFTSTALAGITVTVPGNTVKIYITSDGSINYYGYRVTNIEATTASSTYTITYNGNGNTGGSAPIDSSSYYSGNSVTVRSNTGNLVRTNYRFLGWSTNSTATTPTYAVNGTTILPATFTMGLANVTLYAVWAPSGLNIGDMFYNEDSQLEFTVTSVNPRKASVRGSYIYDELVISDSVEGSDGNEYAVTSIEEWGFYSYRGGCYLTGNLAIPDSVTSIGSYAFYCQGGLDGNLVVPASVTTIGDMAFAYCGFTGIEFYLTDLSSVDPYAFEGLLDIPVHCPHGYKAIYEAYGFTNVIDDLR